MELTLCLHSVFDISRFSSGGIHPVIIKLGLQYAEGVICGSNARCLAMLASFKQVDQSI